MAFAISADEPVADALGRFVREIGDQLEVEAAEGGDDFVRRARVRCKRVRAALRLARPALGEKTYKRLNKWWRDAGRELSAARDMSAQREALHDLAPGLADVFGEAALRALAARLKLEQRISGVHRQVPAAVRAFAVQLGTRERDPLHGVGDIDRKLVAEGLQLSYRRVRAAMQAAETAPCVEARHEWRKQAKHHLTQMRICENLFPTLEGRIADTRKLVDALGLAQDIDLLNAAIDALPAGDVDERFKTELTHRQANLLVDAGVRSDALFAAKPKAWAKHALGGRDAAA